MGEKASLGFEPSGNYTKIKRKTENSRLNRVRIGGVGRGSCRFASAMGLHGNRFASSISKMLSQRTATCNVARTRNS